MTRTAFLLSLIVGVSPALAQNTEASVERGRYLVIIAGCNDRHTEGYAEAKGAIPESEWLKGSTVGFRGYWGTSYATNLRISMGYVEEGAWLKEVQNVLPLKLPPMPWYTVQQMSEIDLLSIHKYITSLGLAGSAAPRPLLPGFEPEGEYISFPGAH